MTRNPYHLLHAGRLMDGVRRGSEVVGGQGAAGQPFTFAELYRVIFIRGREILGPQPGGLIIGPTHHVQLDTPMENFLAMREAITETAYGDPYSPTSKSTS